ncbi:hypothetical protein AJ80_06675 [Polytolypa hystricis UAMH7299]|uniref:FAD/NAD(P)-binding domain-containing protein n=1 Tax=Polytolypa hystricis (strain UAMH7299) TaxID=1447883 RepID=A0A2B7XTT7_POLH7|nr:hypothetical protein AJ80_06675 [Polytolypa hystricis UAMH7299]
MDIPADEEPHTIYLPNLSSRGLPADTSTVDVNAVVAEWFQRFDKCLSSNDASDVQAVFREDAWVRDMLTLSWDFRTLNGLDNITAYLQENAGGAKLRNMRARNTGPFQPALKMPAPGVHWLETMFDFETEVGRGSGVLRLVFEEKDNAWKVYLINFLLQELKGFEEKSGKNRPWNGVNSSTGTPSGDNWAQQREKEKRFEDKSPAVLIIGAGQSGLSAGARLRQLGVPTLIIDHNERIGDNWRKRYKSLVTHDTAQYCHMPYLPFPPTWPLFTPKDKLADWFEFYASAMELNVWMKTTIERSEFNNDTKTWTATLRLADGSQRTMSPRHIILATGHSGEPHIPQFPGREKFHGQVLHASQFTDGPQFEDISSKRVVVVGSGNSGHDICQNLYEHGADVTMLQRGGTYVISGNRGVFMLLAGLYDETGPKTEDADLYAQSMPIPVQFAFHRIGTRIITVGEQDRIFQLENAGFAIDCGADGAGLFRKYLTRGGGYYIDVGCSQLIIDGKVKVRQWSEGIDGFDERGLVLADTGKVPADIIILATGYDNMKTTAAKVMGDKVAARLAPAWDLDEEGEMNSIWRYSGHPGFWYMGGNLALCRHYSQLLALQIKALEEGLYHQPE